MKQRMKLVRSAKQKLNTIWSHLPVTCQTLAFAKDMISALMGTMSQHGNDLFVFTNDEHRPQFSAIVDLDSKGHYAGQSTIGKMRRN